MDIRDFGFKGFFEDQDAETGEEVQILLPENELEESLLAWAILAHDQTVDGDNARRGYSFHYELGEPLGEGMYALTVRATDASGVVHAAEIAAALAIQTPLEAGKVRSFAPMWFLSERVHFKPLEGESHQQYHRPAYGRLAFGGMGNLPHRKLFGATV